MRRLLWALMASLALAGASVAVPATGAGAQQNADSDDTDAHVTAVVLAYIRYGGADRYETSLAVAEAYAGLHDDKLDHVVLVSGERWTDAVVAAPLAGLHGAPVLMMPPGELRRDAVDFLRDAGVTKAIVVGSASSDSKHGPGRGLSDTALSGLAELEISVERVHGADRFGTAVAVAERLTPGDMPGLGNGNTVVVASGDVFADALVAGPFAALGVHPVLLTTPGELHPEVADYLRVARVRDNVRHVVVMGGTAALAQPVEDAIVDAGMKVTRLAGATRYDTAILAAELVEDRYQGLSGTSCFDNTSYGVARAHLPFDAFSAAPLLARLCTSLLLTDPGAVPVPTAEYLDLKMQRLTQETDADFYLMLMFVFGGDAAVSQDSLDTYLAEATQRIAEGRAGQIDPEPDDGDGEGGESSKSDGGQPDAAASLDCGGSISDGPRRLVPSTNAEDPAWSPDCKKLVYTQDGSLWTVNNDGSGQRRLLRSGAAYLHSAAWSPDGDRIAYVRGYQDGDRWVSHIWTVNANGTRNTQLTRGDTSRDQRPRWSPDGASIGFQRTLGERQFLALMDRDGKNERALTTHGYLEAAPAWSPDGTKLAFINKESLFVSDVDDIDDQAQWQLVTEFVYPRGELAWSPSGNRIAFAYGDHTGSDIHIADIDGANQEQVTDLDGQALAPRWSPDGKLLAFHTITSDGKHRSFVVGARGAPVHRAADCRPERTGSYSTGFPRSRENLPTTGKLRIGVLFVDFADVPATESIDTEIGRNLTPFEAILERSSYGKLDVEFVPHRTWLRSSLQATDESRSGPSPYELFEEVVELAGDDVDFSALDHVIVALPSAKFWLSATTPAAGFQGPLPPMTLLNGDYRPDFGGPNSWAAWGASHLVARGRFALPTLWPGDWRRHQQPDPPAGMRWIRTEWGLRGLNANFLADPTDPRLLGTWTFADGRTVDSYATHVEPQEMLAWTRWKLDWLAPEQVACVTPTDETIELAPIADPGDGIAMGAIPITERQVIVLESRRKIGFDADAPSPVSGGARSNYPRLLEEGVLIYTVDAFLNEGNLPVKLAGDSGNGQVEGFPVLGVGDSIELRGYRIAVEADTGDTRRVRIRKLN
ncbi:MAG: hypothetical protein F4117_11640 [Acidimicrobiales bacterium]|nr:hypothetical protein [Acidimicrobiales bacterium]MXX44396.1 hypothetical protein [Acidimicrobiales bacterium]MYB81778.1 hypothetical protein [Acidimicrobiales bacterium]MYI09470.1 hypothetical protein [Acidimicrobiales bacterium]MYI13200.1 hypothetical protein [Acidimicrobiales bacterium]